MDKYIEMFAPLLKDWQQTAIDNTTYSVAIAALAFIIGWQLVVLFKRKGIANLNDQLMKEKQNLEQAEHKHEELLVKQKSDEESIAGLQQQFDQVSTKLQESEEQHAEFLQKHEQLTKTLDEKQSAMDALKLDLDDKTHVVEQIQGKLAEQKNLLAEYALDKAKIEEMKKEASEASSVKQQLLQQENENKEQIKKIEKLEQSAKNSIDRVLVLESRLEKQSHADKPKDNADDNSEQVAQMESMKVQLDLEKRNAESKVKYSVELEQTLQQQKQQLAQFNEKLQALLTKPQPQPVTEQNTSSSNDVKEADGLFGKLLNLVAKMDEVDISDHNQKFKEEEVPEDVWQKQQWIIDQLIAQSMIEQEENEYQTAAIENDEVTDKNSDTLASDSPKQENEVQVNEVTENIQDKLKGFYHKFKS